jgi:hypothetical protein
MKKHKFTVGEEVVCVLNFRTSLEIGKIYIVKSIYDQYGEYNITVDNGDWEQSYEATRFIPRSEFRDHLISQLIK